MGNKIGQYHILFQEKRDQAVKDALKTSDLSEEEVHDIRANIPPVELRDIAKPADSDDEEAKQDFLLKRKIYLEEGRRIARRNQTQGRRLLDFVTSMAPTSRDVSVKHLMEIASENVPQRNKSSNVSLTPLQSSTATNAEEALRLNERRSRLTLQKKARPCQSAVQGRERTTESESFRVTAGAIRTSVTLNDLHVPDPPELNEEDSMSVLSDLYFNLIYNIVHASASLSVKFLAGKSFSQIFSSKT